MRIIHTSDWHLGSQICGYKRYKEHEQFLSWLLDLINLEQIDILIVAGDIFDSTTPPNRSLEQYYQFLARAAGSCCKHIIITAGNHDSPSLISAPRELCKYLNITVVGYIPEISEELVSVIYGPDNQPKLIICPVPYLRDRDVRTVQAGESAGEKTANLVAGIKSRYHEIGGYAADKQKEIGDDIPIIATGHLFAAGGLTREDDGSRDLYLGTLACVGADAFPACIDYVALGHLHLPQMVCGSERIRYCGAPLAMGFGEAGHTKSVLMLDTQENREIFVQEIEVPVFQRLIQMKGTFDEVSSELTQVRKEGRTTLVEVLLDDPHIIPDAQDKIREITRGSPVEVLRVKNLKIFNQTLQKAEADESLDQLTPTEVFIRRMQAADIPGEDQHDLLLSFQEILIGYLEEDANAGEVSE